MNILNSWIKIWRGDNYFHLQFELYIELQKSTIYHCILKSCLAFLLL